MSEHEVSEEVRAAIDAMSYEDLLRRWRFSEGRDPLFEGASGRYAGRVMRRMRAGDPGLHAAASQAIGWGNLLDELDAQLGRIRDESDT